MTNSTRSEDIESVRPERSVDGSRAPGEPGERDYEPPAVLDVGGIRDLVKGSSASGRSDANSQYYW